MFDKKVEIYKNEANTFTLEGLFLQLTLVSRLKTYTDLKIIS